MKVRRLLVATTLLAACAGAGAETSSVSPSGFLIKFDVPMEAEPARIWRAFTELPRWWNPAHSWSGKPGSMQLDLRPVGCWCESWTDADHAPAGAVHGTVLLMLPGKVLRFAAWLGPLQGLAVNGVLTFATGQKEGKTGMSVSYRVSGNADAALDKLAPAVETVIAEQMKRLKAYVETGSPEAAK